MPANTDDDFVPDLPIEDAWSLLAHSVEFLLGYLPRSYEKGEIIRSEYTRLWTCAMATREAAHIISRRCGGPLHRFDFPHDRFWVEEKLMLIAKQHILERYEAGDLEAAREVLKTIRPHLANIKSAAVLFAELRKLAPELEIILPQNVMGYSA